MSNITSVKTDKPHNASRVETPQIIDLQVGVDVGAVLTARQLGALRRAVFEQICTVDEVPREEIAAGDINFEDACSPVNLVRALAASSGNILKMVLNRCGKPYPVAVDLTAVFNHA